LFLLGFETLTAQSLLLREFFSVLSGSDLAFGFALAAWTVLTALGALLGKVSRRRLPGASRWGLVLYSLLTAAALLAVRSWGAREVIPFHAYVLVPVYLAPLCLLGGMLFPWFLADSRATSVTRAYGLEVTGGLVAGVLCAIEFHTGALACPMVLGLLLLSTAWAASGAGAWRRASLLIPAAVVGALLPLFPAGHWLECQAMRLRLREWRVVDVLNTPFASLVAARDPGGTPILYENGTPWPLPEATPGRAAVAACLWALPERCDQALFVHALRQGFGTVVQPAPTLTPPRFLETDLRAQAFARRHLGSAAGPNIEAVAFGVRALQPPAAGWDVVAVFGSAPGGLVANLALTTEFAQRVRPCLASRGVLSIALPAAPGFTHPEQAAYIDTVRRSLADVFTAVCELRTQVGWTLLVASAEPIDRQAAVRRLHARAGAVTPDAMAEAEAVLRGQGPLSIAAIAAARDGSAPVEAGPPAPANRVGSPQAYFRFLQFHGAMVEDAPRWWRTLFRQRNWLSAALLVGVLLAVGTVRRNAWALQGVFWAAWSTTVTLIVAIYLYQSLTGQAFWAVSLLSAASMLGTLAGTGLRRGRWMAWAAPGLAAVPALLFPLYPLLQRAWAPAVLAALLALVVLAGAGLGHVFAHRGAKAQDRAIGGRLFAVDLLGAGAGLFLGGVLLPWWCGFAAATATGALAAALGVALATLVPMRGRPPASSGL